MCVCVYMYMCVVCVYVYDGCMCVHACVCVCSVCPTEYVCKLEVSLTVGPFLLPCLRRGLVVCQRPVSARLARL